MGMALFVPGLLVHSLTRGTDMAEPTEIRPVTTTEDDTIRKSLSDLQAGLTALWSSADAIYCNHDIANMDSDHVLGISYLMKQEAYRMMEAFEPVKKALEVHHDRNQH